MSAGILRSGRLRHAGGLGERPLRAVAASTTSVSAPYGAAAVQTLERMGLAGIKTAQIFGVVRNGVPKR